MSEDLNTLLGQLQNLPVKSESVEDTIDGLSALKAKHAGDSDLYELNKSVGLFLAQDLETLEWAEIFLVKAINENRDDPDSQEILRQLSRVFEAVGDLERHEMVLRRVCQNTTTVFDYKDLAGALLRLGHEEEASKLYNLVLRLYHEAAEQKAQEMGGEVTQLMWPNIIICNRFGELAHTIDVYIKARKLGLTPKVKAILTTRPSWIANNVLLEYWREQHPDEITILTNEAEAIKAEETYRRTEVCTEFFNLPGNRAMHTNWASAEIWNLWEKTGAGPLLKLRDDHHAKGQEFLRRHGAPEGTWFAGLHIREPGYHQETGRSYNRHRNSCLEDYFPAIKAITDRGGWVVRTGDPTMTPLPAMAQVIDYAVATERAEELDVFFCAAAKFMVAGLSGGMAVANVFGTPVLGVDMFPPGDYPYSEKDLYIFRHLQRRDTGEFLNAEEIVAPPLRLMQSPHYFAKHQLDVIANTPEDMCEAAEEMMARLDGEFHMTDDDQANLRRYRELHDYPGIRTPSSPTASFLRRYPHLLA